jgi:endogenous inhibitor of DNA gyrase (YacG/DUF329 family)
MLDLNKWFDGEKDIERDGKKKRRKKGKLIFFFFGL